MASPHSLDDGPAAESPFPLQLQIPAVPHLFGGESFPVTLYSGLTVLLGPNGSGKTHVLRSMKPLLEQRFSQNARNAGRKMIVRLLAAGRSAPIERFRGPSDDPHGPHGSHVQAAVGHVNYRPMRHSFESLTGDIMALQERPDLRVKVEARLQTLFARRLRLEWDQGGIVLTFVSGKGEYPANMEASGVLHLLCLLAALYDDELGALLIDEPEISLHPQLQAFLLDEIRCVAGNPLCPNRKLVVLSTHAQGMLPLRRLSDLPNLVFFTGTKKAPLQVPPDASELRRSRLAAIVSRLGESHRAAFFAPTVLLVEGPSDEIVCSALATRFHHSIAGAGAQIIPVVGRDEMPETTRLFRLMGKRVVVLADLDALADDNLLVSAFVGEPGAVAAVNSSGHPDLHSFDKSLRNDFAQAIADGWPDLEDKAATHQYLHNHRDAPPVAVAKRRGGLVVILCKDVDLKDLSNGQKWEVLRSRFRALLGALEAGGCFFLRRGTIEDCYLRPVGPEATGKPEAAFNEVTQFSEATDASLKECYADALRAIQCAAPTPSVDENAFLRGLLAGLLGTAFQALTSDTRQDEINSVATSAHRDAAQIFSLENASAEYGGTPALRVRITSPLFSRSNFPAVILRDQNLHDEVQRLFQ